MPLSDLSTAVAAARAPLKHPVELIGGTPDAASAPVRFELFHAPNSICSQKVRAVLAHHGLVYWSHTMSIVAGDTYLPDYVRLRVLACEQQGLPLVITHAGSTAVSTGGCDPAVVPTLVDWATGQVVIDSKRICIHLDDVAGGPLKLRPDALTHAIDAELDLVDSLPNYQMLVGTAPDPQRHGRSPRAGTGVQFAMGKVERCDRHLAEHADDAVLQRGYRAKRAKELSAAERLFSADAMRLAYAQAENACDQLERRLSAADAAWLFGDRVTLADLFWGIELLRMKNMGAQAFWDNGAREQVARFVRRCETLQTLRTAVLDWPAALH
jgi:2,5-dichlorohydroquinone reductive dechlorinase